jgi:hypothetical protein
MLRMSLALTFAITTLLAHSFAEAEVTPSACTPTSPSEIPLKRDYKILRTKAEIDQYAEKIYKSDARLMGRAYWDTTLNSIVIPYSEGSVKVAASFIDGIAGHLTMALKNQYADGIIYPDMGHVHLLLPTPEWEELKTSTADKNIRMEKVLASNTLKALYHTVEMVQLKDGDFAKGTFPQDPWKLWRYFTRNLLGTFNGLNSVEVIWASPSATYNTVRDVAGMTEVTTLYFSATHNACLPFATKDGEKYFDITFETIPYESGN